MKRPQDPRMHGLKEPKKTFSKTESIYLTGLVKDNKVSLQTINTMWHKALKDLESMGHRVISGPDVVQVNSYSGEMYVTCTYEWDNLKYWSEVEAYNKQVAEFEVSLAAFNKEQEELDLLTDNHPKKIELRIERAKERLANLEAVRDNKPLPYP